MEPPAKRPRLGRPPRQRLPRDEDEIENENANIHASADNDSDADDEDEITMDPEAFAVKQDPQYRLQVSRAMADNKLKSAFERLFDKYGRDFGDTGDEINFYTDEIEVDNGHIASLPLATDEPIPHAAADATARPRRDGDDDDAIDDDDDDDERGQGAVGLRNRRSSQPSSRAGTAASRRPVLSTWSGSGATARLSSLLTPRSGPGRSWSVGGSDALGLDSSRLPFPGYGSDPVDPAWAVPELFRTPQQDAFASPRQQQRPQEQLAGSQSAPARPLVVRKVLPAAFLRPAKEPRRADYASDASDASDAGGNDEDDLTLETTVGTVKKGMGAGVPTRKIMTFGPPGRRFIQPRSPRQRDSEGSDAEGGDKAPVIPAKRPRGRPRKVRLVEENKSSPSHEPTYGDERHEHHLGPAKNSSKAAPAAAMVSTAAEGLAHRKESLPTPPVDDDDDGPLKKVALDEAGRGRSSSRSTTLVVELPVIEIYARNTLDPSYAFSDEEDGGLRKSTKPPLPMGVAADADGQRARSIENTETGSEHATVESGSHPPGVAPKCRRRRRRKSEMEAARAAAAAAALEHVPAAKRVRRRRSHPKADKDDGEPASTPSREAPAVRSPRRPAAPVTPQKPPKKTQPAKGGPLLASALLPSSASRWREIPDSQGHSSIISLVSDGSDEDNDMEQEPGGHSSHPSRARGRVQPFNESVTAASPLAERQAKLPPAMSSLLSASPTRGLLVETPGGTIRRCGQDDFRCGREFCFRCS